MPTNIPVVNSHNFKKGEDPAAILPLAQLKFSPPSIKSANNTFTWPFGTEGFRRSGSATLGIHKYLGGSNVAVQVIHSDEAHIELTGAFPGLTSAALMEQLLAVITAGGSKDLFLPGIFTRIQRVFTENYDFGHTADDRTHSIDYTISFVRTTVGATVPTEKAIATATESKVIPSSPRTTAASTVGQSERIYTIAPTAQSLREVAAIVYNDSSLWQVLVDLNKDTFDIYNPSSSINAYELPTARLPVGTKIAY
jgi:hypothetical protein